MRGCVRRFALILMSGMAVLTSTVITFAQTRLSPRSAFEVASVKNNRTGITFSTSNGFHACRYVASNATLRMMVMFAYRLPNGQVLPKDRVVGGPGWVDTEHFDIEAKPDSNIQSIAMDDFLSMVQSLFEERFQLRTHWDKRDFPVYDLVVAKDGPRMKRSENQARLPPFARNPVLRCAEFPGGPPPVPPSTASRGGSPPRGPIATSYDPSGVSITGTGITLSVLINWMQAYTDRPIINKSGLSGNYDLKLRFSPERPGVGPAAALAANAPPSTGQAILPVAAEPVAPSIFTAIQELGLKLEAAKASLEVLVIDNVQHPSEN